MAEILIKAASFVAIIFMGYLLRKKGFFKEEDFHVLSKIVLKITLPAAIVSNFSGGGCEGLASDLICDWAGRRTAPYGRRVSDFRKGQGGKGFFYVKCLWL